MSHTLSLVFVLLNLHSNFMRYCHRLGNKGTERLSNISKVPQHQGWDSDPGSQVPETRLSNTMSCCSSLIISTSLMSHMRDTGPRQRDSGRRSSGDTRICLTLDIMELKLKCGFPITETYFPLNYSQVKEYKLEPCQGKEGTGSLCMQKLPEVASFIEWVCL